MVRFRVARKGEFPSIKEESMCRLVFSGKETLGLAKRVAAEGGMATSDIDWRMDGPEMDDPVIWDAEMIKGSKAAFIASFSTPDHAFEQLAAIRAIAGHWPASLDIFVTNLPVSSKRQTDHPGRVSLADQLVDMLTEISVGVAGPMARLHFWDVHDPAIRGRLARHMLVEARFLTAADDGVKVHLSANDIDTVAFPDLGAYRRHRRSFRDFNQIVLEQLDLSKHEVSGLRGSFHTLRMDSPEGRNVAIVDDRAFGTKLLDAQRALMEYGVTHGFPGKEGWQALAADSSFSHVWVTDAHPAAEDLRGTEPFEVVSLAPRIRQSLLAT
jgi:phosphoribosylpyrophosphate synthetase